MRGRNEVEAAALFACRLLVAAYRDGERNGGSIDWSALDDAHKVALDAVKAAKARRQK